MLAAFARSWTLRLSLLLLPVVGCAANDGAASSDGDDSLVSAYGVRAHTYGGFFDGSNEAEVRFLGALTDATAYENQRSTANKAGFEITEPELALNFIAEGAYYALHDDLLSNLDGYQFFGIDTLVDNQDAIKPWLHPSVVALLGTDHVVASTNEKGQTVHTLTNLTLEQGLYANAAMFAYSKARAAHDLAAAGHPMSALPASGQFFWTTIYYNAGNAFGQKALAAHGADYWKTPWTQADDPTKFGGNAEYNALWRTASFDLLASTIYHGADKRDPVKSPAFATAGATISVDATVADDDASPGLQKSFVVTQFGEATSVSIHVELDPVVPPPTPTPAPNPTPSDPEAGAPSDPNADGPSDPSADAGAPSAPDPGASDPDASAPPPPAANGAIGPVTIQIKGEGDLVLLGNGQLSFTDSAADGAFAFPYGIGTAKTWTITMDAIPGARVKRMTLNVAY
jgi:hypothetical protein